LAVPGGFTFATVSAGSYYACGVTAAGAAYCWGDNTSGQLGDGTTSVRETPVAVSGGLTFATVSAGWFSTCGVTTAGALYCWGNNTYGQLGNGATTGPQQCNEAHFEPGPCSTVPVAVPGGLTFRWVSVGFQDVCGVTTTGAAYCWGSNTFGQLGTGTPTGTVLDVLLTPTPVLGGLTLATVSIGELFACGVTTAGAAYCWGSVNEGDYLGNGATDARGSPTPVAVSGGLTFAAVGVGNEYACGVTTSGAAYCWGNSPLGVNSTPVAVPGGFTFATLSAGWFSTCGVTTAGAAYCWGRNDDGELGNGARAFSATPVAVSGGLTF